MTDTRWCGKCKEEKSLEEFTVDRSRRDKLNYWCRSCTKEDSKEWHRKNADRAKEYQKEWDKKNSEHRKQYEREYSYKKVYGLPQGGYQKMFAAQGGKCAICDGQETSTRNGKIKLLAVDHCHETGEVRGLLCALCNASLGGFKDSIYLLSKAIEYRRRYNQ